MFALHNEFSERIEMAELCNSQHSGQLPKLSSEINVNTVKTLIIKEFCSLTCQKMVAIMGSSKLMIKNIIKKLCMRCVALM